MCVCTHLCVVWPHAAAQTAGTAGGFNKLDWCVRAYWYSRLLFVRIMTKCVNNNNRPDVNDSTRGASLIRSSVLMKYRANTCQQMRNIQVMARKHTEDKHRHETIILRYQIYLYIYIKKSCDLLIFQSRNFFLEWLHVITESDISLFQLLFTTI